MTHVEERLTRALQDIAAEVAVPDDLDGARQQVEARPMIMPLTARRSASPRRLQVAAAVLVTVGLGGVWWLTDRPADTSPSATPRPTPASDPTGPAPDPGSAGEVDDGAPEQVVDPSATVAMVLAQLPAGLSLVSSDTAVHVRDEPSSHQVRLFGAADDPGDPERMIRLEYGPADAMPIPCHSFLSIPDFETPRPLEPGEWVDAATPMEGSVTFAVGAAEAAHCPAVGGLLQAGWFTDHLGVGLLAGRSITPEELTAFAQVLQEVSPVDRPAPGPPDDDHMYVLPVDLIADPLPEDLVMLVHNDMPYVQGITETGWTATVGGSGQMLVRTWQGVDEQGVFAVESPVEAERITIRGREGYRYVSEQVGENGPLEVRIWWVEQPDVVVAVWSSDLFDAEELTEIAELLQPVDAAGYAAFVSDPANS